jgi:hypothetical protein
MTALIIDGVELSQTAAAELLALAPDVPADTANMPADTALATIHQVLAGHDGDTARCLSDLAFEYGEHPEATAARIARCRPVAARLIGGAP